VALLRAELGACAWHCGGDQDAAKGVRWWAAPQAGLQAARAVGGEAAVDRLHPVAGAAFSLEGFEVQRYGKLL